MPNSRDIALRFRPEWDPGVGDPGRRGLLAPAARARTPLGVLVSYPEVPCVVPDRISPDAGADPRLLETIGRFLRRQDWLVTRVVLR
jgi:hypothetical protein